MSFVNIFTSCWFFVGGLFALVYFHIVKNLHRWRESLEGSINQEARFIDDPDEREQFRADRRAILQDNMFISEMFSDSWKALPPENKITFILQLIVLWPWHIWEMFHPSNK